MSRETHVQFCERAGVRLPRATHRVILCWPGKSQRVKVRLDQWLASKGLKLNEKKTRLIDHRRQGFEFLGFSFRWAQSQGGNSYSHVEPSRKSQHRLREKLRSMLHRGTHWRPTQQVITEVNQVLLGWSQYFHYANSTEAFTHVQRTVRRRMRSWLWKKHGKRRKWVDRETLHERYGLYRMPTDAQWKHPKQKAERKTGLGKPCAGKPPARFDEGRG